MSDHPLITLAISIGSLCATIVIAYSSIRHAKRFLRKGIEEHAKAKEFYMQTLAAIQESEPSRSGGPDRGE